MTENEEKALEELVWELSAPHTQEEIASRLGISQARVSQIESGALEKLRSFIDPDWVTGVREPPRLATRMGHVFPGDGMDRTDQRE